MIKIDKGVPIPRTYAGMYPFEIMEVRDSFIVENLSSVRSLASRYGKATGKRFIVQKQLFEDSYRCWRIK